jgi:hypothetical protein
MEVISTMIKYQIGEKVLLNNHIKGLVCGIRLCPTGITYSISYWKDEEYKLVDLYDFEFLKDE